MIRLRNLYDLVMFSGLPEEVWLAAVCLEPIARRVSARIEEKEEHARHWHQDGSDQ